MSQSMAMTRERWERIQRLFNEAMDRPPDGRLAFIERECGTDVGLHDEVLSLLRAAADDGKFDQRVDAAISDTFQSNADLEPGQMIGRFKVVRLLGRGGMGAVYLATRADDEFQHSVAIKTVGDAVLSNRIVARLRSERQILANLNHPNIARLLDGGATADGKPYLAMEYVEGRRIDEYCRDEHLDMRRRLELFQQVCAAVQYAHQQLVIHRDIKPNNILVTAAGTAKLLDFGIAKLVDPTTLTDTGLTRVHERVLTPDHASPEQVRGEPVGTASDVYALGLLLYGLLAECKPFDFTGQSLEQIEKTICTQTPPRPSERSGRPALRGDLDTIVLKAMHRDVPRRYASAAALADDVANYLAKRPITGRPDSLAYRTRKFVERNTWGVASAAAVLVTVVGLTTYYTARLTTARDVAELEARRARFVSDYLVDMFKSASPEVAQGRTITAIDLLKKGESALDNRVAEHPEVLADLSEAMASSYYALGDNAAARRLFTRALSIRKAAGPAGVQGYARALANLGQVKYTVDDYAGALTDLQEALRLQTQAPDTPPLELARTYLLLADCMFSRNDFDATRANIEQSRRIIEREHAQQSLIGADAKMLQAALRSELTDYRGAEPLLREVIATREKLIGALHPDTLDARERLAVAVRRLGRFREAADIFDGIIRDKRKVLGPDHADVGSALALLASVEVQLAHFDRAEALARESMQIAHDKLGPDNSNYGSALRALANTELARGRYASAQELFARSIEVRGRKLAPDDADLQRERMLVAACLREQGRFAEANEIMDPVIRYFEERDDGRTMQGSIWYEAGRLRLLEGRLVEARTYLTRGEARHKIAHDEPHPNHIYLLATLAQLELQERDFAGAAATSRRALDYALDSIPDSTLWIASLQGINGAARYFQGDARGKAAVEQSYEALSRLRPPTDYFLRQAKQRLESVQAR